MSEPVVCPSGLEGEIRPIKVKDEKLYTDKRLIKSGRIITELCKRCWLKTTKPGPYPAAGLEIDWPNMLQGDIFAMFIAIRRASYGDIYPIEVPCQHCEGTIREDLDLSLLEMEELNEKSAAAFADGQNFAIEYDGRKVEFRLLVDSDTARSIKLQEVHELTPRRAMLAQRLVSVEGVEKRVMAMMEYVKEMAAADADDLLDALEEYDCGIDTLFAADCPDCGEETEFDLPIQAAFFRRKPTKEKTKKRKRKVIRLSESQPN